MQNGSPLILTPLYSETKHLIDSIKHLGVEVRLQKIENLNVFFVPQWNAWVTSAAMGKEKFALKAKFWLEKLPDIYGLICVGSAGSLSSFLKPFDVVIAESILEHDYNLQPKDAKLPEHFCNSPLLQKAKDLGWPKGRFHLGKIASGDENIVDPHRAQQIANLTGAVAVAWEGAGLVKAAKTQNQPFLEIRAITDLANAKTYEDFKLNLKPAMQSLAQALTELL